jgi:hypothetical protein
VPHALRERQEVAAVAEPGIISTLGITINYAPVDLTEAREIAGIFGRSRFVEKTISESVSGNFLPRLSG